MLAVVFMALLPVLQAMNSATSTLNEARNTRIGHAMPSSECWLCCASVLLCVLVWAAVAVQETGGLAGTLLAPQPPFHCDAEEHMSNPFGWFGLVCYVNELSYKKAQSQTPAS